MILFSKKKPSQSQTIEEIIAIALNLAYFINKLNSANYNQNKPPYLCIHIYLNIAHEVYNIQLKDMMNEDNRVYRVYADGVFDCFHLGHANMLKQAKQCLPGKKVHLIAGINKQSDVEKFKGKNSRKS
jgi:cytidyltransferase-like protein